MAEALDATELLGYLSAARSNSQPELHFDKCFDRWPDAWTLDAGLLPGMTLPPRIWWITKDLKRRVAAGWPG